MADTTLTVLSLSFRFCRLTLKVFVVRSCLLFSVSVPLSVSLSVSVSLSLSLCVSLCVSVSVSVSLSVSLSLSLSINRLLLLFSFSLTNRHEAVTVDTVQ